MKGPNEHQDQLPELSKKPEPPKPPQDPTWVTVKPGVQQNSQGQMRTVRTDDWGPL